MLPTGTPNSCPRWASARGDQMFKSYSVQGVPGGFALMFVAGVLSALLGIGSGVVKVLAMDRTMRLPFKVRSWPR